MLRMESVTLRAAGQGGPVLDLNLHTRRGSLYALVGEAGSGKSTALKLAAGLLLPESGRILIDGCSMDTRANRRRRHLPIGYVGRRNEWDPGLKLIEFLEFYAHIYGKYGLSGRDHCMELLKMAGLERRAESLMGSLPRSVLRQAEILRALIHRPRLLLADAPFSGMDPRERNMTEEIMRQLCAEGMTIVITCSSLADTAMLCDSVGLIRQGRLFAEGNRERVVARLKARAPVYAEVTGDPETAAAFFRDDPEVLSFSWYGNRFRLRFDGSPEQEAALLSRIEAAGIRLSSFYRGQAELEEAAGILSGENGAKEEAHAKTQSGL